MNREVVENRKSQSYLYKYLPHYSFNNRLKLSTKNITIDLIECYGIPEFLSNE